MQLQSASTTNKNMCARRLLSWSEQLFASLLALRVIVALSVVMVWNIAVVALLIVAPLTWTERLARVAFGLSCGGEAAGEGRPRCFSGA